MNTTHSPLPWRLSNDPAVIESDGAANDLGFVAMVLPDSALDWNLTVEAEANAQFIVTACNSHAALLGALENIIEKYDAQHGRIISGTTAFSTAYLEARQAIALAKGETK